MGAVGLGDDHDAGRVLVEAVDDAGPLDAADARQAVAAMVDQRVDQRAGPVAGARMDDQPGRLVDDDQVVVLVENVERDVLALRLGRLRLGQVDSDGFARFQLAAGIVDRPCRRPSPRPGGSAPARGCARTPNRVSVVSHWSRRTPAASGPASNAADPAPGLAPFISGMSSLSASRIGHPDFHHHGAAGTGRRRRKTARPGGREGAPQARALRRHQSRPAVHRPYGRGGRHCLQVAHGAAPGRGGGADPVS